MKSVRLQATLYFLLAFLPAWVTEASAVIGGKLDFLGWSLLVAKSLIPGVVALAAFFSKTSSRPSAP